MKNIISLVILSTLALSSCAQEPSPVVDSLSGFTSIGDLNPADSIVKNAVTFKGTDFFGQQCGLALSLIEENGEHVFLTKLDYKLHGEELPAIETNLYRFVLGTNTYSDSQTGTGTVTFGGALLSDETEADMNQLSSYESTGNLLYSLRVETGAASATDYEEALEEVINDPSQLAAYSSSLDQITRIVFKLNHAGHYDASGCIGLKLDKVMTVEFKVGEHDDHDHDHD